jgi:FlaA1/EpsC-like NDP-sugar epimerase
LGLYRGLWRFASLPDLKRIAFAVTAAALATPAMLILFRVEAVVPRSVLLLDPILLLVIMGGSRLAYRAWKEHRLVAVLAPDATPVLIAGAGSAADFLLRELQRNPGKWRAVGLLDDDSAKKGRHVQGVPVLGSLKEMPVWAAKRDVKDVVLALPSASHEVRRRLAQTCSEAGLNVLTVPSIEDVMNGRLAVTSLRPIELDDLLGRDPVKLDDAGLVDLISGRSVLVTGAGGSIGSELCRQIARFGPARLVFFENSELALYRLEQEFRQQYPALPIVCIMGDVKDAARVNEVMAGQRPSVVFHAAAYKHVPLVEEVNTFQALRNNVLGTLVCARAALEQGVEKFVMISTDKAVNPTNVMGASKRLAEMVCQALQGQNSTRFISVRFGNVLGSSGSVIPKFQEQIARGGPVTVTHPEITRYFMSIPEAAQLVLQAGLMGQGGEIFVLDMGEPVKIADLAKLMIRLSGHQDSEISITYTGLRPGEKLYEELLADSETTLPTPHPKLRVARAREVESAQVTFILDWIAATATASDTEVRERLRQWVPEYQPAVH